MKDTGLLLELPVAAGAGWINEGLAGVNAVKPDFHDEEPGAAFLSDEALIVLE